MRWEVKGADANTGEERVMSFEAASENEASNLANYKGLLVASIERIYVGTPVPENTLDYRGAKTQEEHAADAEQKAAEKAKRKAVAEERRTLRYQIEYRAMKRRAQEWLCLTRGERAMYRISAAIGFLLAGAGIVSWFGPSVMSMTTGIPVGIISGEAAPSPRFITDNAIGASANAAEAMVAAMRHHLELVEWDIVVVIGVMFMILSAFIRHRGTVRAGTMSA